MSASTVRRNVRVLSSVFVFFFIALMLVTLSVETLFSQVKRPVTIDDFDVFQTMSQQQISSDGQWVAYYQKPRKGDGELSIVNIKTDKRIVISRGTNPTFTDDSQWVAYTIIPHEKSDAERKAEEEARKASGSREQAPREYNNLEVMNLSTEQKFTIDRISNFKFSGDSKWLAYKLERPEEPRNTQREGAAPVQQQGQRAQQTQAQRPQQQPRARGGGRTLGVELILRNLAAGTEIRLQEIDQYFFTENSEILYFIVIGADSTKDGFYFKDMTKNNSTQVPVLTGKGRYSGFILNEKKDAMLILSDRFDPAVKDTVLKIYSWKLKDSSAELLFDPLANNKFPKDKEMSSSGVRWSKDGKALFFSYTQKRSEISQQDTTIQDANKPTVDIWQWQDLTIQPQQWPAQKRSRANRGGSIEEPAPERPSNYQGVYYIKEKDFVPLTDDAMRSLQMSPDELWGIGSDRTIYEKERPWDPKYNDYYFVNLKDGFRKPLEIKADWSYQWSGSGNYLLQYIQPNWWVIDLKTDVRRNLTEKVPVEFWNTDDDHPTTKNAWGTAGWLKDDEGVLINDKYDIWYFPIAKPGEPVNVTMGYGRKNEITFRYQRTNPDDRFIDLKKPLRLTADYLKTRDDGIYEVTLGSEPRKIFSISKALGTPRKAKNAEIYLFTLSRTNEYGNIWVSDGTFTNLKQISFANKDNNGFIWGKSQLIDYRNVDGVNLQAILTVPETYQPGQKLPMIVYMYEKLTQGLHSYSAPTIGSGFPVSHYVSNGYAVLQPDIIYTDGYPGPSSVNCVVPAVQKAIDMGIADPAHIGLTGHSWGGYQTAYIITQTNIFACAYAGAAVVNMTSAYGGIRWESGNPRTFQYETGQSRIGGSLWEYPERYVLNSPIFYADKIKTPVMFLHGDGDGAVPWYQSIEFYLALRRLGKPAWFLQYNDEPHSISNSDANRLDFTIRRMQFFDHFLKDKEMPLWMKEGVKYTERGSIK